MPHNKLNISGAQADILSWVNHELSTDEHNMLRNVSRLPCLYKHVALMPDAHLGIGSMVGSVVATKDAVIPATVGVDIGCFTGDTLVPTIDGKSYSLRELAENDKEIVVYACTESGKVVAAKATAKQTRRDAELVKVVLDNGPEIRCTPDHKFMLRDGSFIEAKDLSAETSLMPLYRETDKDDYVLVQQNYSGRMQKAHWIVARSGLLGTVPRFENDKTVIHHRNFDEADNRPENLEFMSASAHSAFHRGLVERNEYWQSPDFEAKRVAALSAKAQTAEGHSYFAERGTKNILKYMAEKPEHFKISVAENGKRGKKFLVDYNQSEKGRAKSKEIANRFYDCETCGESVKSGIGLHNHRLYSHGYNHKVISVESIVEREDVYCLTVPKYHNFALEAGVFVHNCGMAAIKTPFKSSILDGRLKDLRLQIERTVPVGFSEHKSAVDESNEWNGWKDFGGLHNKVQHRRDKAMKQLGTLGGGNHFIEVCLDTDDNVWLMLHSGSRNIGNEIASRHIETAKSLHKLSELPDPNLAYFIQGTEEFKNYWRDLEWAQAYAFKNREIMVKRILRQFNRMFNDGEEFVPEVSVNCHHNYVSPETHFGEKVYVTRKGAIRADTGMFGIIPGSMGAKSFIIKGLGNPQSFNSCSHGAGRKMSRTAAKKKFTREDLERQTAGVECRKDAGVIDEIPSAYKNIDEVMRNQNDLVEVVAQLKQVVCVKG
ncbi:MAG TPA: RtcB family protein [Pyrinomonadaceae bacterium]|nr:RtcB family protein [Pyrinomonadaceae bacterium]